MKTSVGNQFQLQVIGQPAAFCDAEPLGARQSGFATPARRAPSRGGISTPSASCSRSRSSRINSAWAGKVMSSGTLQEDRKEPTKEEVFAGYPRKRLPRMERIFGPRREL